MVEVPGSTSRIPLSWAQAAGRRINFGRWCSIKTQIPRRDVSANPEWVEDGSGLGMNEADAGSVAAVSAEDQADVVTTEAE